MRQQDHLVWKLLQAGLYDRPLPFKDGSAWEEIFTELRSQSVALLPADRIRELPLTSRQKKEYSYFAAQQIACWNRIMFCQQELVLALRDASVPAAVLKGAAAAMYYPKPWYRSMGDIDLIVGPGDFDRASEILEQKGCRPEDSHNGEYQRHVSFERNGMHIELHRFFSTKRYVEDPSYLDEKIYKALSFPVWEKTGTYTFPVLPQLENGLVLLQHISQHLETGLGLRQILDWMLYVESCLPDGTWNRTFGKEAERIGLKTLALVTTRMCQMYLGLSSDITWCREAREDICRELMTYVMNQGNFGRKDLVSSRTVAILYYMKQPFSLLQLAQRNGCKNWRILKKHPFLKPFAWLYQLGRWARKGTRRTHAVKGLREDMKKAARQDAFLDELGVRRGKREQEEHLRRREQ